MVSSCSIASVDILKVEETKEGGEVPTVILGDVQKTWNHLHRLTWFKEDVQFTNEKFFSL